MNDRSEISHALIELCDQHFPTNKAASVKHVRHTVSLISNPIFIGEPENETRTISKIQRRLAKHNKTAVAVKFGQLCQQLQTKKSVKNRAGLLQFLFVLNKQDKRRSYQNGDIVKLSHFRSSKVEKSSRTPAAPLVSDATDRLLDVASTSSGISSQSATCASVGDRAQPRIISARNAYDPDSTVKVSEDDLLRDVLFALQAIDGRYITFNPDTKEFVINPRDPIPQSTRQLVGRIIQCGSLYWQIERLCDHFKAQLLKGCIKLALISTIQIELNEYYRTLTIYKAQLDTQRQSKKTGVEISNDSNACRLTLRRLLPLLMKWKEKLALLLAILRTCQDLRGGQIISTLFVVWNNGDFELKALVGTLLESVCRPLLFMIGQWIFEGKLEDPHDEFFVGCHDCVKEENFWNDKFLLRNDMIPCFFSVTSASRVLLTGKSIYLLRIVCPDSSVFLPHLDSKRLALKDMQTSCLFEYSQREKFESLIDFAYSEISRHLLNTLNDQFYLFVHFVALKRYVLLSQGDFALCLIDLLQEYLNNAADQISRHSNSWRLALDTALKQTNARYELKVISERIIVDFLDKTDGDTGWDIFRLKYSTSGILATVLSRDCIVNYGRLFGFIWRLKRVSFSLCNAWQDVLTLKKKTPLIPEFFGLLHSIYLLRSEMAFFVEQMQFYFLFEVLECAFDDLIKASTKARDLDDVIRSHARYLDILMEKSLLKSINIVLLSEFRTVIDLIFQYCTLHCRLLNALADELDQRETFKLGHSAANLYSETSVFELREEQLRSTVAAAEINKTFRPLISVLLDQYRLSLKQFIATLASHEEEYLRLLSFRLDFSQFYRLS